MLQAGIQIFDELASQVTARIRWGPQEGGDCHPLWICEGHSSKRGEGRGILQRSNHKPTHPLWLPTSRTTSSTISRDGRSAYAAGSGVPAQRHCEFSGNKQTHKPANPAKEDDQRKCEPPGLTSEIRFPMKKTNAQTNNSPEERHHLDGSEINVSAAEAG